MKNFAIVGVRLLAIWAFIKATVFAQYLPSYLILEDDFITATGLGIALTCLFYIAISILLFFKAPTFAEKITAGFGQEEVPAFDYQKLAAVLFSTAGLLIFIWAIESFIQTIGSLYNYRVMDPQNPDRFWRELQLLVFGGGIQMLVGTVLFLGGKKIAKWWHDFRDWT